MPQSAHGMAGCRKHCMFCQAPLSFHDAVRGDVCSQPSCRRSAFEHEIRTRDARIAAALAERASVLRSHVASTLGCDVDRIAAATVPSTGRALVRLPLARKLEFREFLSHRVADVFRTPLEDGSVGAEAETGSGVTAPDVVTRVWADACGACRGDCCVAGSTRHAFLDGETLGRYRQRRPDLRPRDIVRAYVSRLPLESVEGSCVFHGADGCTLPRPMRATICNEYLCPGLHAARRAVEDTEATAILILAATGGEVVRWRVHDRSSTGVQPSSWGGSDSVESIANT